MIISTSRKRWSAFDQDGGKAPWKAGPIAGDAHPGSWPPSFHPFAYARRLVTGRPPLLRHSNINTSAQYPVHTKEMVQRCYISRVPSLHAMMIRDSEMGAQAV